MFANLDIYEICRDPEALASGFGYEEMQGVLHHDPDKYDENGMVEDPERLKEFIRTRMFLTKEQFNYNDVRYRFLG